MLDEFHCSAAQTLISVKKGVRMVNHPTMGNSSTLQADGETRIDRANQPASPAQAFQVVLIAPQQPSTSLQSVLPGWTVNIRLVCHFGACPSIHTCQPRTGASRPQAAYSRATTRPIGEGENHRPPFLLATSKGVFSTGDIAVATRRAHPEIRSHNTRLAI